MWSITSGRSKIVEVDHVGAQGDAAAAPQSDRIYQSGVEGDEMRHGMKRRLPADFHDSVQHLTDRALSYQVVHVHAGCLSIVRRNTRNWVAVESL
jgi:hypothetical protein